MTLFMVETYVIKPDKQMEFSEFGKKYIEWKEKRPDLFKEVKSWKLFAQVIGGSFGRYVEMWEFENLADMEKAMNRMMQDKDFITMIYQEFASLIVPATHTISLWNPVP